MTTSNSARWTHSLASKRSRGDALMRWLTAAALLVTAATSAPAPAQTLNTVESADHPPIGNAERPPMVKALDTNSGEHRWSQGVSEEQQQGAARLFAEGNLLLKDSYFLQAEAKYREALALWDHPGVRYNLALSLTTSQADPLKVREQFVAALRYGAEPLDEEKFKYATYSLGRIEQRLAPIEITCSVPGAVVSLDGTELFHAPGRYREFANPGPHLIRAIKPGFETTEYHETLSAGKGAKFDLPLYTEGQLYESHTRWPFWIPVAVTGGGAALVGLGAIFLAQSNSKLKQFDSLINARSDCTTGCVPDPALTSIRDSGNSYKTAATVTFVAGGAVFAGGVALIIANLPESRRVTPEEHDRRLHLQPTFGAGFAGLSGVGHF